MHNPKRGIAVMLSTAALGTTLLLTACSPVPPQPYREASSAATCDSVLSSVIHLERTDDRSGAIESDMDWLGRNCPLEYQIAVDYFSEKAIVPGAGVHSCDTLRQHLRPEAVLLLEEDGLCSSEEWDGPEADSWPEGGIGWNEAQRFVGSFQRVCGPLASVRGTDDGVFVNVGRDYPSPDRFTFVIWGDWWLDPIASDATVCAPGSIYLYRGAAQIELNSPDELEIWR